MNNKERQISMCFLLIILMSSLAGFAQEPNLITNPGFENGFVGWSNFSNNGSDANFTIESLGSPEGSNHVTCDVITLGINDWDIQLRSNEFAVDETHQYRLTFKAKSETPGDSLKVFIQKSAWMGKNFTMSDSWTTYTYEFFPNELTKELKFNFVNVAKYYIDSISVVDISNVEPSDFNTPPSCVIMSPYVNEYYKTGDSVTFKVYASDEGGSQTFDGSVSKVEFFVDNVKVGERTSGTNSIYSIKWKSLTAGNYTFTAKATDDLDSIFTSAGAIIKVGTDEVNPIGLSANKGKYLGNVVRNSGVDPNFLNYWNGVTSGNGCKWGSVERVRDVMKWTGADEAYDLAYNNNLAFRYHAFVWGSQYPTWIETLAPADFQAELEEYIAAVAGRYPYVDQIDVMNEVIPGHQDATQYFIDGLGGTGESGYDWAVWVFKKAREYFPNTKLILNDFGIVNSSTNIREQLKLIKVLRDSALIDGFGAQSHTFSLDGLVDNPNALQNNLNLMATSGVPIYITELDMKGKVVTEASQLASYETLFPKLWEHPAVAGITFWGFVYDNMWQPEAGLVNADYSDRLAMTWLRAYIADQPDVGYPLGLQNVVSNPGFEDGLDGWSYWANGGGSATFTTEDSDLPECGKTLKVDVAVVGTDPWDIQLENEAINLDTSRFYQLSFKAKSVPAGLALQSVLQTSSYQAYSYTLTDNWETYTWVVKPDEIMKTLKFNFVSAGEYYIDDISLNDTIDVTSVSLSTDSITLEIGEDSSLVASVAPIIASNSNVTFASRNSAIVSVVDSSGIITGVGVGNTYVIVETEDGKFTDSTFIDVSEKIFPVTTVDILHSFDTIDTDNAKLLLPINVGPDNASDTTVSWRIIENDADAAIIDTISGEITPLHNGVITVRATSNFNNSIFDEATVVILNQIVEPLAISIVGTDSVSIIDVDNGTLALLINTTPAEAMKDVYWSMDASDTDTASIDAEGVVTAKANGIVSVLAMSVLDSAVFDTYEITITNQVEDVVNPDSIWVIGKDSIFEITSIAGSLQMIANVFPSAADTNVVWSIETVDAAIASINEAGLLTAKANGIVTVIATSTLVDTISGQTEITISGQETTILVSAISVKSEGDVTEIFVDSTLQLTAMITPDDATDASVVWSVESAEVASVSQNGLVTANAEGFVKVTATAKDGSEVSGTIDLTISIIDGIKTISISELMLYPNPVENKLSIANLEIAEKVEILNSKGQIVRITSEFNHNKSINVSGLERGVYVVRVIDGNIIYQGLFIKQ